MSSILLDPDQYWKRLEKVLNGKLNKMFGHNLTVMTQPNARLNSEDRLRGFTKLFWVMQSMSIYTTRLIL